MRRLFARCLADDKSLEEALEDIISQKASGGYEGNKAGQEEEEED